MHNHHTHGSTISMKDSPNICSGNGLLSAWYAHKFQVFVIKFQVSSVRHQDPSLDISDATGMPGNDMESLIA